MINIFSFHVSLTDRPDEREMNIVSYYLNSIHFISTYPFILISFSMRLHTINQAILSFLAEAGPVMIDTLIPPHPRSHLARSLLGLDHRRYSSRQSAKHAVSSVLGRLKKQGLVVRNGPRRYSTWEITPKGEAAFKEVIDETDLPHPDGIIRLVSFDIPEKKRSHRRWLRTELLACDFEPLHKSVLVGKRPLPQNLIQEIEARDLMPYVHIVSIEKSGTIIRNA